MREVRLCRLPGCWKKIHQGSGGSPWGVLWCFLKLWKKRHGEFFLNGLCSWWLNQKPHLKICDFVFFSNLTKYHIPNFPRAQIKKKQAHWENLCLMQKPLRSRLGIYCGGWIYLHTLENHFDYKKNISPWWFKVTFLGWLSDPFKGLSDLQLGDEKGTLNHLVPFLLGLKRIPKPSKRIVDLVKTGEFDIPWHPKDIYI